jgi:ferredoxin
MQRRLAMQVTINRQACVGYASCMMIAPEVFDVDDDDLVVLLSDNPDEAMRDKVEHAARSCPKKAITVDGDGN